MTARLRINRAAPATTIQDDGRFGALQYGISASGPMDRGAFHRAGTSLERPGSSAIEFSRSGIDFTFEGNAVTIAGDGGAFELSINGRRHDWPARLALEPGDRVEITPGPAGNYGYLCFDRELDVPLLLGSRSTNLVVGLGGLSGRALRAGDVLNLLAVEESHRPAHDAPFTLSDGPFRFIWGIHADLFPSAVREAFVAGHFLVSDRLDRMGTRLIDPDKVFGDAAVLSLVSDAIVPGDVQILGDGTPIVLMRDHQPTGGYPRIATLISADLDRFAQLRPGTALAFAPVTLQNARHSQLASVNR